MKSCLLGALVMVVLISVTTCQTTGSIRLTGFCRGNVEVYNVNRYVDFNCDRSFGSREARVACREVGCNPSGARRISPDLGYGGSFTYVSQGYRCFGFESSLSGCRKVLGSCNVNGQLIYTNSADLVAIQCGPTSYILPSIRPSTHPPPTHSRVTTASTTPSTSTASTPPAHSPSTASTSPAHSPSTAPTISAHSPSIASTTPAHSPSTASTSPAHSPSTAPTISAHSPSIASTTPAHSPSTASTPPAHSPSTVFTPSARPFLTADRKNSQAAAQDNKDKNADNQSSRTIGIALGVTIGVVALLTMALALVAVFFARRIQRARASSIYQHLNNEMPDSRAMDNPVYDSHTQSNFVQDSGDLTQALMFEGQTDPALRREVLSDNGSV